MNKKNYSNVISNLKLDEKIVVYALAVDRFIDQYEFYHVYLGSRKYLNLAKIPSLDEIYSFFKKLEQKDYLLEKIKESDVDLDRFDYYHAFIKSMIVQIELFIFNKKLKFSDVIENLLSLKLVKPFNLKKEFLKLQKLVQGFGFLSVKDYRKEDDKNTIRFKTFLQLKNYINSLFEEKIKTLSQLDNKYKIPFTSILASSKLNIKSSSDISCYYKYLGNYKGEVSISRTKEYKVSFLKTFLSHECLPGHHLYYLIRQNYIENNRCDLLYSLDTYYSPENCINEGLAVCSSLIFEETSDNDCTIRVVLEKFMHKFFYNGWYNKNISKLDSFKDDKKIILNEIGVNPKILANQCKYFFDTSKYYSPTYVLGINYIEKAISSILCSNYKKLYNQYSCLLKDK